jgi:hypothetical protein
MLRTIVRVLTPLVAMAGMAAWLAGCTVPEPPKLGAGPPAMGLKQVRNLGPAPVKGNVTVAFTTVTGTPAEMRFALEKALKKYAATRNLTISVTDDPTATYRIKGYLSAVGDRTSALVVYVWDVYDTGGHPLHRISGQQPAKGSDADPWVGVTLDQIDDAARDTIDRLVDWLNG